MFFVIKIIKKLQNKPRYIRKNIALFFAVAITLPIVIVWVSSFSFELSPDVMAFEEKARSPFSIINEELKVLYNGIKSQFGQVIEFKDTIIFEADSE